jgi:hypothetical protein
VFAHLVPLSSLLAAANPGPLPPLQGGSLPERKQQLSEAIAINTSRISSSLRDQRTQTLRTSLPGSLRVLFGAAIVSAFYSCSGARSEREPSKLPQRSSVALF